MGLWFPSACLSDAEPVAFEAGVNLFRGRRQIGGRVTVTDRRFLFVPNRLDGLLGGHRMDVRLADITNVTVEPAGSDIARGRGLSARFRPQVEIHLPDQMLVMTLASPDHLTVVDESRRQGLEPGTEFVSGDDFVGHRPHGVDQTLPVRLVQPVPEARGEIHSVVTVLGVDEDVRVQ